MEDQLGASAVNRFDLANNMWKDLFTVDVTDKYFNFCRNLPAP